MDDPDKQRSLEALEALLELDRQRAALQATLREAQALLMRLDGLSRPPAEALATEMEEGWTPIEDPS